MVSNLTRPAVPRDIQREAGDAVSFAWSLAHETDPDKLLAAWNDSWSVVREAVLANPNHPACIDKEASALIRKPVHKLDNVEKILVSAIARIPIHSDEDWRVLALHADPAVSMEMVGNPHAPNWALRLASKRCVSVTDITRLLANPNTPYDVLLNHALMLAEKSMKEEEEYVTVKELVAPLLRVDLSPEQRAILFPLLFTRIPSPYMNERGYPMGMRALENAAQAIIGNQSAPSDVLALLWEKIIIIPRSMDGQCRGAEYWVETHAVLILTHHNCPASVLTSACLHPSQKLREWATMHPNCPDYAHVAAVLSD